MVVDHIPAGYRAYPVSDQTLSGFYQIPPEIQNRVKFRKKEKFKLVSDTNFRIFDYSIGSLRFVYFRIWLSQETRRESVINKHETRV